MCGDRRCGRRNCCQWLGGEPPQGLSESPPFALHPSQAQTLGILTQAFIQESGAASLPWSLPAHRPPPHRTPFRWGLSFICLTNPPPGLHQQVGGGGAQEEPPTCRGRQFWQGRWAGISLEPPPRPRIEVGGAGGVQAGGAVIGGNLNS